MTEQVASALDLFTSEYGWSLETCLDLTLFQISNFTSAILERKYHLLQEMVLSINIGSHGKAEDIKAFLASRKPKSTKEYVDSLRNEVSDDQLDDYILFKEE